MVLKREPVLIQAAILAIINLLVAFSVLNWTATQLSAVNAVLAAVLGLITRQVVTPLSDPKNSQGRQLVAAPQP